MQMLMIILGGGAVAVAMPVLYLAIRAKMEIARMTPLETQELMSGIWVAKDGHANVYLIRDSGGYIAFDAGEKSKITGQALQKLGIDPLQVKAVFLTHTDFDHDGAISLFKNADVYIAKAEEQMINGTTPRTFGKMGILRLKNKLKCDYQVLHDGDVVTVGNQSIECVLTPGHTPGSMCYILNGKYLFSGDTLRLIDGKVLGFVPFFTMDRETNQKSIQKLARTKNDIGHILTAHHGYSSDPKAAFSGWVSV